MKVYRVRYSVGDRIRESLVYASGVASAVRNVLRGRPNAVLLGVSW